MKDGISKKYSELIYNSTKSAVAICIQLREPVCPLSSAGYKEMTTLTLSQCAAMQRATLRETGTVEFNLIKY